MVPFHALTIIPASERTACPTDEPLNREIFYTLLEVQVLTDQYRQTYNRLGPHSSLVYRHQAPKTILPADAVQALARPT